MRDEEVVARRLVLGLHACGSQHVQPQVPLRSRLRQICAAELRIDRLKLVVRGLEERSRIRRDLRFPDRVSADERTNAVNEVFGARRHEAVEDRPRARFASIVVGPGMPYAPVRQDAHPRAVGMLLERKQLLVAAQFAQEVALKLLQRSFVVFPGLRRLGIACQSAGLRFDDRAPALKVEIGRAAGRGIGKRVFHAEGTEKVPDIAPDIVFMKPPVTRPEASGQPPAAVSSDSPQPAFCHPIRVPSVRLSCWRRRDFGVGAGRRFRRLPRAVRMANPQSPTRYHHARL